MTSWIKVNAYLRLGLANLIRVFWYLLRLKSGLLRRQLPLGKSIEGEFFAPVVFSKNKLDSRSDVFSSSASATLFGWYSLPLDSPPDWHLSVLNNKGFTDRARHWSLISDFASGVGDIKGVWEPSRFTWVINLAANYLISRKESDLERLNHWITHWSKHNVQNAGANWKCAQEASFRVLHLAAGAMLLDQRNPSQPVCQFVREHLRRISPTLGYAKAQDNNHGTSEAAALFVGASWLLLDTPDDNELLAWYRVGREYLTERMTRLVMSDGSFSQYSVNYHRLMLDSISLVELWRRYLALPELPKVFQQRAQKAAEWLYLFTDKGNGDTPNLGANDGAHILNYLNAEYRDYRPSVELACMLFLDKKAFGGEISDKLRHLFQLPEPQQSMVKSDICLMEEGGYGLLFLPDAWCSLRVPRFKFRPGQADILHLDLWVAGKNLLKDAGSFSYNTQGQWLTYFNGVQGHNTIQFDNRESMPKVSRFLYGSWPNYSEFTAQKEASLLKLQAHYQDWQKVRHQRSLAFSANQLTVTDTVSGFAELATLRWRLAEADWNLQGNTLIAGNVRIEIFADVAITRLTLANGFESRYYGKKQAIPVLEVDVSQDAQITTIIHWT